jgi:hypothetical protein
MAANGKPLTKMPSKGTAKLYRLADGDTVRARTCNDHILIAVADEPSPGARLNIEGTDWIMLVMPEIPRTPGAVLTYLLPTKVVVDEVRRTHAEWLASRPNTKGENTTWNLWFRDDGPEKASGYARKWDRYRLPGKAHTNSSAEVRASGEDSPSVLREEISGARERIARLAGVPLHAVRVSIDFDA